jgi:hypothetical protein
MCEGNEKGGRVRYMYTGCLSASPLLVPRSIPSSSTRLWIRERFLIYLAGADYAVGMHFRRMLEFHWVPDQQPRLCDF